MRGWRARGYWLLFGLAALALGEALASLAMPGSGLTPFEAAPGTGLPARLRPSFSTHYTGVDVRTNALGMRGPPLRTPGGGELRVAVLGDSFVFGSGVEEPDTISHQLELALAERGVAAEVWNLGVPGYNGENVLEVARGTALALSPDVLLYVFFANDVDPVLPQVSPRPDARVDPRRGYLMGSALAHWCYHRAKNACLALGWDVNRNNRLAKERQLASGGRERLERVLAGWEQLSAESGIPVWVALYPYLAPEGLGAFTPADNALRELVGQRDLRFADLEPAVHAAGPARSLWANPFDSHPNGRANRAVAAVLAEAIAKGMAPADGEAPAPREGAVHGQR